MFLTTLALSQKVARSAKSAFSCVLPGLLCLLLPGCLLAGTTLTYTGNAYPSSSGCSGSYGCNGTTPFLTFSFHTTLSVSQLAQSHDGEYGTDFRDCDVVERQR